MGEKIEIINNPKFVALNGMKIPLINNNGNLITFINTIISEVISVGFAAISKPNKDPKIAIIKIPVIKAITCRRDVIQMDSRSIKTTVIMNEIIIE
jgi:hypothetical protein